MLVQKWHGVKSVAGDSRLIEEEQNHDWHGKNREDGGDSDEFGGFDVVAAVFSGEETERGGGGECLN